MSIYDILVEISILNQTYMLYVSFDELRFLHRQCPNSIQQALGSPDNHRRYNRECTVPSPDQGVLAFRHDNYRRYLCRQPFPD